jgi:GNAT superfamily N-acetyltransferase
MRTTVPGDIEMLKAAGFDVHARRSRQNKYYLENINFELPELKILIDAVESSAISLFSEYRGQGIGTRLMKEMLSLLKEHGYRQASLAVQKANYAVRMYRNVGFEIIDENDEEYIMACRV